MHHLGHTRSAHHRDHLLHTPDTFIRIPLPGLTLGMAIVHAAPALGAAFTQYTVEFQVGGSLSAPGPGISRFVYVLSGTVDLASDAAFRSLPATGFCYLPADAAHTLTATEPAVLQVIDKPYTPLENAPATRTITGIESDIPGLPLGDDPDLLVRSMIPSGPEYDFAVNTMSYAPGASLALVEVHVMEHGLLMLEGGGIYRLNDQWYPVQAGDFIWMGPYCPQWFGAIGKKQAKYLIYKDFNRHPLS